MKPSFLFALPLSLALCVVPAMGQHDHSPSGDAATQLGTVHFQTSCKPEVEKEFNRAVALLHSFWFSAAIQAFNGVLEKDPSCAMANWGIAMSWWGNPFGGFRPEKALEAGRAAVEKAKAAGAPTERERDYIAAVETLYKDHATVDQRTRTLAYEKAMEQVAAKHEGDPEARIFYALSLDQTHLPSDKTYKNLLHAAEILEKEFKTQPDHPGIAHYIIHSYDVPPLAPKALDAARRYAKIAPDAPHALHMPSHTFTRVGSWEESIETNIASAKAARKDKAASEELHALDYQVYAYLQTAQDEAAKKVTESIPAIGAQIQVNNPGAAAPAPAGFFALAAIPARYTLERAAWADAAKLEVRETPFAWADAVTHFARALGAARSGNPGAAAKDVEKLKALRDKLQSAKDAYWTEQVDIQSRVASAWVVFAEGRKDEAIAMMREAADMEDKTEKSAVSPGPIKPARELLGEMLLEAGRAKEALAEFQRTMDKEPNRFRGFYGAAKAAEASGDSTTARAHYQKLVEVCALGDDPGRKELAEARNRAR
jgi:tetratricopeptide (TPR) repeat protein